MAALRSLGVHTPSALPYLIAEGILPAEPSERDYTWETFNDGGAQGLGEEEIVSTDYCVVYSTGGVVRKVFRFEVEEQKVQQAVLTWFPSEDGEFVDPKKAVRTSTDGVRSAPTSQGSAKAKTSFTTSLTVRQKPGYGTLPPDAPLALKGRTHAKTRGERTARALVVFLKFQAHVYFVRGSSHVVNLPFEVERAFPAPRGLILQRRLPTQDTIASTPALPSAPQNSFLSPEALQPKRRRPSSAQSHPRRLKDRGSGGSRASFALDDLVRSAKSPPADDLPRHYSLTDPLSEMGLVVSSPGTRAGQPRGRNVPSVRQSDPLHNDEEILYVSSGHELPGSSSKRKPLIFLVTANQARKVYVIYSADYIEQKSLAATTRKRSSSAGAKNRRRSSFVPGTGATTPAVRPRDQARESIGANAKPAQTRESSAHPTAEETFVSQLDPDYDSSRQPARESRRVSSLISRVDMSTNQDRSTFQDMASGHGNQTSSFGRRGPSFGAATSRTSLGGRKSYHRPSTPGSILSRQSLGNSSDEESVDQSMINSRLSVPGDDDDSFETITGDGLLTSPFQEPFDGLKKEFLLQKITEIPMDEPGSFSSWTKSEHLHRPRIFAVAAPTSIKSLTHDIHHLCLHIVQPPIHDHIEVIFNVHKIPPTSDEMDARGSYLPVLERSHRIQLDLDAIKITEHAVSRVLSLQNDPAGKPVFKMRTCWGQSLPATTLPVPNLNVFNPFALSDASTPSRRIIGRRRTLDSPKNLKGFAHVGSEGSFDVVENNDCRHRLQVQLGPRQFYLTTILEICTFVLPEGICDVLRACWWELCRMIEGPEEDKDWFALVTTLLALGVGHVRPPTTPGRSTKSRATSRSHRRESSLSSMASTSDADALQAMWARLKSRPGPKFWTSPAWSWSVDKKASKTAPDWTPGTAKSDLIISCIARARAFLSSETGSALLSPLYERGEQGRHDLPRILMALHLFREEQKLNILCHEQTSGSMRDIALVLGQLGRWLRWDGWSYSQGGYYDLEDAGERLYQFEDASISGYPAISPPPFESPPSIFEWVERSMNPEFHNRFPSLGIPLSQSRSHQLNVVIPKPLKKLASGLTPRTIAVVQYFERLKSSTPKSASQVELMAHCGIDRSMIETLPESVLAPLKEALVRCEANPPTTWNAALLKLIGRDDLNRLSEFGKDPLRDLPSAVSLQTDSLQTFPNHAIRDIHTICQAAEQAEPANFTPELERHRIAQLIFNEDRRYWEAEKLLNTLRPAVAECIPDPSWSDAEVLEAQKGIVQWVMVRTFSLASGQSMFYFDSKRPLITEKFHIHGYNMSCLMRPMNITVSAERLQFTEEKYGWAWFHAGVSAGLAVSKHAEGIDTSWVVFNKPADLSNRHAGLLLGLGLNGHLRSIAKWLSFKYLTPKHTMTSIGLLLGLSVSFLGSMDTLVTRLLSVHITRMLPPGAAELNLSQLTQTTGLMGIGMLYYATQHRRMSEIMLSEIEHAEVESTSESPDNLRDESYRLAAGFALGFINLGKGADLRGLHDMRVVERLLAVAVGPRPVDLVHILDQATAGAVIAIALIFMKTHDKTVARRVDVPDTLPQFDYVRPDILLLRTLARHLIMWDDIKPSEKWIQRNLPPAFSSRSLLSTINSLKSEHLPFYNILAGLLWAVSLKYAGSGSIQIRDFLITYLDIFIRIAHLPAHRYDARLTRNTVRNCQDLVALSCATVMAGTGDLVVFRRLRRLHGRVNPEITYGSHMAAHMALGILFLAGGGYTFGTSNLAVASLILSFYPLYPSDVTDNRSHLQAFRHFWVLAAEARTLVVRDLDTKRAITMPLTVRMKPGIDLGYINDEGKDSFDEHVLHRQAPCLLPDLSHIAQITTVGNEYWPVTFDFASNPSHLAAFRANQTVFVRRRPASAAHSSVFSSALVALNDSQNARMGKVMWEWIFQLPVFDGFEQALWGLVLPSPSLSSASSGGDAGAGTAGGPVLDMGPTVVDERLRLLSVARRGTRADQLRDLKAIFAWAEEMASGSEGGRLAWLGKGTVEGLKKIVEDRGRAITESKG
ncbi:hypothetical protein NA57DRAFT_42971 [Rhizodiscina lignyota]|uniref:Anaphase-promoting complex subunit 1 n=1 Tax=Rhizodiscina lignyota TaxID=1504668 RepID=A0A9P4M4J6_9PEZI|nr:hypothetical protein NA57DRAFT_42971 [Rhizodiscina lignyota]